MKKKEYKTDPNYHTYQYVVVAHVEVADQNGQTVRKYNQIVGRAVDEKACRKMIFKIRKMEIDTTVAYENGQPILKKTIVNRPRISYINNEGQMLTENVTYSVLTKTEYFENREVI